MTEEQQLDEWLLKHGSKPVTRKFLLKLLEMILQPIVKTQRDEMTTLRAANHGLQVRCDLLQARILELEATAAARGEKVIS